jgi:hypothetical protein
MKETKYLLKIRFTCTNPSWGPSPQWIISKNKAEIGEKGYERIINCYNYVSVQSCLDTDLGCNLEGIVEEVEPYTEERAKEFKAREI